MIKFIIKATLCTIFSFGIVNPVDARDLNFGNDQQYKNWVVQNDGPDACRSLTWDVDRELHGLYLFHDAKQKGLQAQILVWLDDRVKGVSIRNAKIFIISGQGSVGFDLQKVDNAFYELPVQNEPGIIPLMREGSTSKVVLHANDGEKYVITYSLSGFTAAALQIQERCNFDIFAFAQTSKSGSGTQRKERLSPEEELVDLLGASYMLFRATEAICKGYFPQDRAQKFLTEGIDAIIAYHSVEPSRIETLKDEAWSKSASMLKSEADLQNILPLVGFMGTMERQNMCIKYVDGIEGPYRMQMSKYLQDVNNDSERKF